MNRRSFLRLLGLAAAAPAAVAVARTDDLVEVLEYYGPPPPQVLSWPNIDAESEFVCISRLPVDPLPFDDHYAHIVEHIWYYEREVESGSRAAQALLRHIGEHQDMLAAETTRFLEHRLEREE